MPWKIFVNKGIASVYSMKISLNEISLFCTNLRLQKNCINMIFSNIVVNNKL